MSKRKKITIVLLLLVIGAPIYFFVRYQNYLAFGRSVDMSVGQMWRVYGAPDADNEWMFSLIVEAERENWDKVARLTADDHHQLIGTYYHNLAMAKQGRLSQELMNYYQPAEKGLLLPIEQGTRPLFVSCAGEAWYQMGAVIMAEHATMLGLTVTPSQSGARFYRRLAQIAHINGDSCSAQKYERLLGGKIDDSWKDKLQFVPKTDTVFYARQYRLILQTLLKANPDNMMAYEYLLCYDLLLKDIGAFVEDYVPRKVRSKLYDEALLIYLAGDGLLSDAAIDRLGIDRFVVNNFNRYGAAYMQTEANKQRMKELYGNTYWYYFHFAERDD